VRGECLSRSVESDRKIILYKQYVKVWQEVVGGYLQVLPQRFPVDNNYNHEEVRSKGHNDGKDSDGVNYDRLQV
jgi:hypothetical protein